MACAVLHICSCKRGFSLEVFPEKCFLIKGGGLTLLHILQLTLDNMCNIQLNI